MGIQREISGILESFRSSKDILEELEGVLEGVLETFRDASGSFR